MGDGVKKLKKASVKETLNSDSGYGWGPPAGPLLAIPVRDGSAAITSKMELQQPPKMFCNFLQKGLAKNTPASAAVGRIRLSMSPFQVNSGDPQGLHPAGRGYHKQED